MLVARGQVDNRQAIVRIGVRPFAPAGSSASASFRPLHIPINEYRALIDTGAQRTCLARSVIVAEQLSRHGKKEIQNVFDVAIHSLYLVMLGVFCERVSGHREQRGEQTYFGFSDPIEIIDIAGNARFDAIIGMDVITKGDLGIERDGSFHLILG